MDGLLIVANAYDYADDMDENEDPHEEFSQSGDPTEGGEYLDGVERLLAQIGVPNLCDPPEGSGLDDLEDSQLAQIGKTVVDEFEVDEQSLEDSGWKPRHDRALKLATQTKEVKNTPWPNAANVKYPLITVSAMQFAARAYPAIVDGWNVVKGKVLGKPSPDKRDRADRIGAHMSYQLLQEMDGWEEDTDQLLHILPVVGTVFRKTYFDPTTGKNCSVMVTAEKMVVNYHAKANAPRMTQIVEFYPHEIEAKVRSGLWRKCELGEAENGETDRQAPHTFLEQHTLYDLDEDGVPEPYIITVHKETAQVVRMVARYRQDGLKLVQGEEGPEVYTIEPVEYYTRYRFIPPIDGSYYGLGFGTLLDALSETINSLTNQLLDAGTLANLQGGFLGDGVSMKSGDARFRPGEWKRVKITGGTLRDNIVPLPAAGPSEVLFKLLDMLIEASKDITATKDILTGDTQQANAPVGTTLAQIEQGLKVYSSIYKRVHRALKHELGLLYDLNAEYLDPQVYFEFQDDEKAVSQQDYAVGDVDVIPVSDPSIATDMQRIGRAQFLMQFRGDPLVDPKEVDRRVFEAAGIQDIDTLWAKAPPAPDPKLVDNQEKNKLKARELDIKESESKANVEATLAGAQKDIMDAMMQNPDFMVLAAKFIEIRRKQLEGDNGPVQPGAVPGMAGPPANDGVPGVPEASPGAVGPSMGAGAGDVPVEAGGSPPAGGPGGPQMV